MLLQSIDYNLRSRKTSPGIFLFSHAQIMRARKPGSWPHCQNSGDSIRPCRGPRRLQNRSLRQFEDMIRATSGATSPDEIVGRWLQWAAGCCARLARCEFILAWQVKKLAWLVVIHAVTHRYCAGNLPRRGFHCGTCEYVRATLPVSCTVHITR